MKKMWIVYCRKTNKRIGVCSKQNSFNLLILNEDGSAYPFLLRKLKMYLLKLKLLK